jgi:hypothetical protein
MAAKKVKFFETFGMGVPEVRETWDQLGVFHFEDIVDLIRDDG